MLITTAISCVDIRHMLEFTTNSCIVVVVVVVVVVHIGAIVPCNLTIYVVVSTSCNLQCCHSSVVEKLDILQMAEMALRTEPHVHGMLLTGEVAAYEKGVQHLL